MYDPELHKLNPNTLNHVGKAIADIERRWQELPEECYDVDLAASYRRQMERVKRQHDKERSLLRKQERRRKRHEVK